MNLEMLAKEMKDIITVVSSYLGKKINVEKLNFILNNKGVENPKAKTECIYIYSFWHEDFAQPLKIGKDGSKSKKRYDSYHYKPNSTTSNLAKSLINNPEMSRKYNIDEKNITKWMQDNLYRINIEIPLDSKEEFDVFTLEIIEAALHYKYRPMFEGRNDQR